MAQALVAMLGDKKARRLKIVDFLLRWGSPRRQTTDDHVRLLSALSKKD